MTKKPTREGYEAVPISFISTVDHDILRELGFNMDERAGRACSLCPTNETCRDKFECDLDPTHSWVPTHVAAILKMQPGVRHDDIA